MKKMKYPTIRIVRKPGRDYLAIIYNSTMRDMLLATGYEYVRFQVTPKLLIIKPSPAGQKICHKDYQARSTSADIVGYGLKSGKYKVYRCGDCFAIKRYEPLPEDDDDR